MKKINTKKAGRLFMEHERIQQESTKMEIETAKTTVNDCKLEFVEDNKGEHAYKKIHVCWGKFTTRLEHLTKKEKDKNFTFLYLDLN